MMRSMFAGVTGLRSHQTRMDVIGNNIANVNTAGFKKSSVTFKDLYSETISAAAAASGVGAGTTGGINPKQIGLGAAVNTVSTIHTPGSAQYTGNGMDVAISGDGYFVVETPSGKMYTRAGNFFTDQAGNLVTGDGYYVQTVAANQRAVMEYSLADEPVNDFTMASMANDILAPTGGVIQRGNITADLSEAMGKTYSFRFTPDAANQWEATMRYSDFVPKGSNTVKIDSDGWTNTDVQNAVEAAAAAVAADDNVENDARTGTLYLGFTNEGETVNLTAGSLELGSHTFANNAAATSPTWTGAKVSMPTAPNNGDVVTITVDAGAVTGTIVSTYDTTATPPAWSTPTEVDIGDWTFSFNPATGELTTTTDATGSAIAQPTVSAALTPNGGDPNLAVSQGTFASGVDANTVAVPNGGVATVEFTTGSGQTFTFDVTNNSGTHWLADEAARQVVQAIQKNSELPAVTLDQNGVWEMYDDQGNLVDQVTVATTDASGGGITGEFMIATTEFGNFNLMIGNNKVLANQKVLSDRLADSTFSLNIESEWGIEYTSPGTVLESELQNLTIDFDRYSSLAIDPSGAVMAQLENDTQFNVDGQTITMQAGEKVVLGYVSLANFNNPTGLEKIGDNLYAVSANSGNPVFNMPGIGNAGSLTPSNLEMSNVDLSEEIVNMIITQRGFQANSRIITTTDTMLEELVNLKR